MAGLSCICPAPLVGGARSSEAPLTVSKYSPNPNLDTASAAMCSGFWVATAWRTPLACSDSRISPIPG